MARQAIEKLALYAHDHERVTLEDVRAEVLSSDRLNAMVSGVFAGVALLLVGVAANQVGDWLRDRLDQSLPGQ